MEGEDGSVSYARERGALEAVLRGIKEMGWACLPFLAHRFGRDSSKAGRG